MKLIIATLIAALTLVTTVSAATGSTSTGSTSTGSTSTGVTLTGVTLPTSTVGGGGITRGFNLTTKQYELVPQCFPWAWLLDFYKGNIFMIYENQKACQKQRSVDFGI